MRISDLYGIRDLARNLFMSSPKPCTLVRSRWSRHGRAGQRMPGRGDSIAARAQGTTNQPCGAKRMSESAQKKLLRVRPPRVRITYDVHTNGAIEKRELPFIVGIFADLTGDRDPDAAAPVPVAMKERRIVDIDRDNFNEVLRQSVPRVLLKDVDNVLPGGSGKLAGEVVVFESISDFDPVAVVRKVKVLNEVFEQRKALRGRTGPRRSERRRRHDPGRRREGDRNQRRLVGRCRHQAQRRLPREGRDLQGHARQGLRGPCRSGDRHQGRQRQRRQGPGRRAVDRPRGRRDRQGVERAAVAGHAQRALQGTWRRPGARSTTWCRVPRPARSSSCACSTPR